MRANAAPIPAEAPVTSASFRSIFGPRSTAIDTRATTERFKLHAGLRHSRPAARDCTLFGLGVSRPPRRHRAGHGSLVWVSRRYWMADQAVDAQKASEDPSHTPRKEGFWALALGSVGVVFGDIGT